MSEWEMQFGSLNEYLEGNCKRFSLLRGRYRKPILAGIISDWPEGIKDRETLSRVLHERGMNRLSEKYGSVIASLILSAVLSKVIELAIEWWLKQRLNQKLMRQYHAEACQILAGD
tara:strand:- start:80 stop:427 length:348 start_codon:yes stop_codon:yes gene_type:complete